MMTEFEERELWEALAFSDAEIERMERVAIGTCDGGAPGFVRWALHWFHKGFSLLEQPDGLERMFAEGWTTIELARGVVLMALARQERERAERVEPWLRG